MSKVYDAAADSAHKEKILADLKTVVNDLTGIKPENVDIHAHFMEVGIDSLTLIQATQLVKELFDVKLSVVQLLEQLTNLDALASYIAQEVPAESRAEPAAPHAISPVVSEPQVVAPSSVPPIAPPAPTFAAEVRAAPAEFHSSPLPALNGGQASTSALDQIMSQQLQLMAQQLEMLHAYHANNAASARVETPARVATPPVAIAAGPKPQTTVPANPSDGVDTRAPEANTKQQPVYIAYQPIEPGPTTGLTEKQQQHLDRFIARFNARTRESKRLAQEYRPYLSDSRNTFGFRLLWKELVYPIFGDRSAGSRVWDVDGNEYVDISMGFGVHLFGHSPDFIDTALRAEIDRKSVQLGPQVNLAGKVARLFSELTGQERVSFCNSGTEAVMAAMRLARTVTRRSKIAIFGGAYHGWSDLTSARVARGKDELTSVPIGPGISAKGVADVVVLDWDSPAAIAYLKEHEHELAAVMVEPVQSRRPDIQPREFLHQLRELTAQAGTALIFDEMITGFRIHTGGAQTWFGVQADIATYGKVIGGGLPIGVIAGKAAYLDAFDGGSWNFGDDSYPQSVKTLFAGAFFKHPLTMAAAQAVLHRLRDEPSLLPELNDLTARLVARLNRVFAGAELPVEVVNFASLFRFMFAAELKYVDLFFYHMLEQGIYIWEGRNCFLSTAHSEEDSNRIVRAVENSIAEMQAGGFWPEGPGKQHRAGPATQTTVAETSARVATSAPVVDRSTQTFATRSPITGPKFSLYYFGNYQSEFSADKYELLLAGAQYADQHGFEAVWIPERHFHAFGGFSPNPSVVAAALARETHRVRIHAGSVVLPLHNPIRVAEEWSVVDNLSNGRIGISFASGWQPNDFVFAPEAYATRHDHMYRGIEVVQRLWRGEKVPARSGNGKEIEVGLAPLPRQRVLPTWLTGSSPVTFTKAGELGFGILTNLQDQSVEELAEKIALYRTALKRNGHDPASARVTLLLHTFLSRDLEEAREKARRPLYRYMKSSLALMSNRVKGSNSKPINLEALPEADLDYILSTGYDRYVQTASLIGTTESCKALVDRLSRIGVSEVACMIDFGIDTQTVLESLDQLSALREQYQETGPTPEAPGDSAARESVRSIPLTDSQRQLWISTQMSEAASAAYNESISLEMRGPLDLPALQRALQQLVDRHESLRVTFSPEGDCQWISPHVAFDLPFTDFSSLDPAPREAEVAEWKSREVEQPFDLVRGPLIRGRIAKVEEQFHLLVLTLHHLVSDGESSTILMRDLRALYTAEHRGVPCDLPPATPFSEYVQRQTIAQSDAQIAEAENYWLEQFADSVPILELPTDRPRPLVQTYNGAPTYVTFDPDLYEGLKRVSAQHHSTLLMVFFAVSNILFHRLSGQDDIVVGTPAAGQVAAGVKDTVGYCINMLPIRSQCATNPTFAEYLRTIRRSLLNGFEHQNYSPSRLIEKLNIKWDPSRPPLFSVTFNFDKSGSGMRMEDVDVEVRENAGNSSRFDLSLAFLEFDDGIRFESRYNSDLFNRETIEQWMQCCLTMMRSIVENPQQRVLDLPCGIELRTSNENKKKAHERRVPVNGRQLEEAYVAPRDETEKALAQIWADVLGIERVGIENKFFDLGGNSLVALQIIVRVLNTFQVELTMRHIFESPTVAQLAATITHLKLTGGTHDETGIDSFVAHDEERLLENIDQLSDQQVDLLLNDIMREEGARNG
jgi:natural product biosynthesis luciferase-like monooxygenase protein